MSLSKINRLGLYNKLKKNLKQYSSLDIENGVMFYWALVQILGLGCYMSVGRPSP